jgi:8-hydroxy-5-deazaflavin:NADPH oxidoreductase
MRIGVLGTGMVGRAIATKLVDLGHEVRMGSRTAGNEKATAWVADVGEGASEGDFAAAAEHGELVFNCTAGTRSLDALAAAGPSNLAAKILVDIANPLESTGEGLPILAIVNADSLGERIQAAFPEARVVKALNTMNCEVMVDPGRIPGDHAAFVCGNDDDAKAEVSELLGAFGWPVERVIDLGDISAARGTEMYLALWLRIMAALGTSQFNVAIEPGAPQA